MQTFPDQTSRRSPLIHRLRSCGLGILLLSVLSGASCSEPVSDVYEARRHYADYDISAITFRAMDDFFNTLEVKHGSLLWELPYAASPPRLSEDSLLPVGDGTVRLGDALAASDTNAFLVMQNGEIVFEQYYNGSSDASRFIGFSISKSIVSLLIGVAVAEGDIRSIDDAADVYWPALADTAFAGVSIRHMLQMRDGVDYVEWAKAGTTDIEILKEQSVITGQKRFTDVEVLELTRPNEPGAVFNYSTLTSSILGRVLEEATGMSLAEYTQAKLWQPAGMEADAFWLSDGLPPEGKGFGGGG